MTYVIAQPCVDLKDKACIDECPVDCIYEEDLPEGWSQFESANAEIFKELGSPGGAGAVGPLAADHPLVGSVAAAARQA